jgi:hypothetical protein
MFTSADKLSRKQERKLVEIGRRIFAENFPNPTREGCPSQQVLRAMAFRHRQLPINNAPVDHLTICSPCFQEYSRYRKQAQQRTILSGAIAAAAVLAIIGAGLWVGVVRPGSSSRSAADLRVAPPPPQQHPPQQPVVEARLDLRRWSPIRGEEGTGAGTSPELRLPRSRLRLTVLLPIGSEEGAYDIVLSRAGNVVATARSDAELTDGITLLQAQMDLTLATAGQYKLRIQRVGSLLREYPVKLE